MAIYTKQVSAEADLIQIEKRNESILIIFAEHGTDGSQCKMLGLWNDAAIGLMALLQEWSDETKAQS